MRTFLLFCVLLAGCEESFVASTRRVPSLQFEKRSHSPGVSNARYVGSGYMHYEIEDGTVTCREHTTRSELACWKR